MTSIVVPVKSFSKNNHKELVYALRSIEKHLKGFGEVFIIGDRINSLKGLKYIHCRDDRQSMYKERNIYRKILKACNHPEVTEDFIMLNDDHLLLKDFDVNNLPFYYKGTLEETLSKNMGDYRKSVNHTRKLLLSKDKPTIDFDTHFPIVYNKKKFIDTFVCNNVDWDKPFGYVIKSLYCNLNDIEGEFGGDCKIHHKMKYEDIVSKIGDRSFFSTSDGCLNEDMMRFLNEKYGTKSRYER